MSSPNSNSNNNNKDEVDVREVESPSAFYKNIPKVKNAPYVAGLEPERYGQLTPLGHEFGDFGSSGAGGVGSDLSSFFGNLDPNATYYASSTRTLGLLMILLAFALFGVWNYVYNQDARFIPTNQQGAQSSYQEAGLKSEQDGKNNKNNNNNNKAQKGTAAGSNNKQNNENAKKNKKTSSSVPSFSAPIKTAPDAIGLWSNVEFALDKIRAVETLKGFAIINKNDVFEWISHPVIIDGLFQCFAVFVLTVVSIAIARAIPAFLIFCCVGISVLGWVATLGDVFIVGSMLNCFKFTNIDGDNDILMMQSDNNNNNNNNNNQRQSIKDSNSNSNNNINFSNVIVSASDCTSSFPLIMHSYCVNTKWICLTLATTVLIISVRLRGGLCFGLFKNYINLSVLSGLPVCAQLLRLYLWYTGLGVVKDAIGPQHGWILTHHEELVAMSFHVLVFSQVGLWILFGIALMGQGTLLVLEAEIPATSTKKKSDEFRSKIKGLRDGDEIVEDGAVMENDTETKPEGTEESASATPSSSAQRSWKTGNEVRSKLGEMARKSNETKKE